MQPLQLCSPLRRKTKGDSQKVYVLYTKRMLITEKCTLERIVKKYLYIIVHTEFIYIHLANVYKPFAHMHI